MTVRDHSGSRMCKFWRELLFIVCTGAFCGQHAKFAVRKAARLAADWLKNWAHRRSKSQAADQAKAVQEHKARSRRVVPDCPMKNGPCLAGRELNVMMQNQERPGNIAGAYLQFGIIRDAFSQNAGGAQAGRAVSVKLNAPRIGCGRREFVLGWKRSCRLAQSERISPGCHVHLIYIHNAAFHMRGCRSTKLV